MKPTFEQKVGVILMYFGFFIITGVAFAYTAWLGWMFIAGILIVTGAILTIPEPK